jgi:hypothetical protein
MFRTWVLARWGACLIFAETVSGPRWGFQDYLARIIGNAFKHVEVGGRSWYFGVWVAVSSQHMSGKEPPSRSETAIQQNRRAIQIPSKARVDE